jgi:Right handed beta helix region
MAFSLPRMRRKRFILITAILALFLAGFLGHAYAATYYVDNSCSNNGDGSAQTCASSPGAAGPFNSIANGQSAVTGDQHGNSLLLKKGERFHERYVMPAYGTSAGQFTLGSYGSGADPIIDGADVVTGWTNTSGNIWQATRPVTATQVFRNDVRGIKEASQAALTADYEWYQSGSTLYIYTSTNPNTDGSSWEADGGRTYNIYSIDRSYVTVENLQLYNSGTAGTDAIVAGPGTAAGNGLIFQNLTIKNSYLRGILIQTAGYALSGLQIQNVTVSYCNIQGGGEGQVQIGDAAGGVISNVTISNLTSNYGGDFGFTGGPADTETHGLLLDNVSTATITGSTFEQNGSDGISIQNGTTGVTISSNTIADNGTAASGDRNGIGIGGIGNGSSNLTISGNAIYGNGNHNIEIATTDTGATSTGITFEYNSIHDSSAGGIFIGGNHTGISVLYNLIYSNAQVGLTLSEGSAGSPAVVGYGNTLYGNGTGGGTTNQNVVVPSFSTAGSLDFENNIIAEANGLEIEKLTGGAGGTFISNHNIFYYSLGGNFMSYDGTAYSFSGWQSASGQDANSQSGNPSFTNTGSEDFTLTSGSPAIDAGTNLGSTYEDGLASWSTWPNSVTTLNQNTYGAGWEIGAYVYGTDDPSHAPQTKVVVTNSAPQVSAVSLNHGSTITLTADATTSVDINYTITDANGCSDIVTNPRDLHRHAGRRFFYLRPREPRV